MIDSKMVSDILIHLKCVVISPSEPFTYASGLQGPIYCDNRRLLSFPRERKQIIDAFIEKIRESELEYDSIAGLATAGIPHGTLIADRLDKPFIYIRSKAKGHGKQSQIEGVFEEGDEIILIEDLVNQGKSLNDAVEAAVRAGLRPRACFSIVDYQMENAKSTLEKYHLPLYSLTTFSSLTENALSAGAISREEFDLLVNWQKDPANWRSE